MHLGRTGFRFFFIRNRITRAFTNLFILGNFPSTHTPSSTGFNSSNKTKFRVENEMSLAFWDFLYVNTYCSSIFQQMLLPVTAITDFFC